MCIRDSNYEIVWQRVGGEQGVGAYNGDIGIVESINTRDRSMVVRMDDKRLVYPCLLYTSRCV